jgi:hypothetical protein
MLPDKWTIAASAILPSLFIVCIFFLPEKNILCVSLSTGLDTGCSVQSTAMNTRRNSSPPWTLLSIRRDQSICDQIRKQKNGFNQKPVKVEKARAEQHPKRTTRGRESCIASGLTFVMNRFMTRTVLHTVL